MIRFLIVCVGGALLVAAGALFLWTKAAPTVVGVPAASPASSVQAAPGLSGPVVQPKPSKFDEGQPLAKPPSVGTLAAFVPEELAPAPADAAQETDVPDRLRRAMENRDAQYRGAKLKLLSVARYFVGSVDRLAAEIKRSNLQLEIVRKDISVRMRPEFLINRMAMPPPQTVQPIDAASHKLMIDQAGQQLDQALEQYRLDVQQVDYEFYRQFADIFGPNGQKKKAPLPTHPDLDRPLDEALWARANTGPILFHLSGMRPDWRTVRRNP